MFSYSFLASFVIEGFEDLNTLTSSGWRIWVVCAGMQTMCMSLFLANSMASIDTCDECPSKISSTGLDGGMDCAKNLSHVR